MEGKESRTRQNRAAHDRKTLKTALRTMSVDQLRRLRSTIIRLKHLPFTKLTEVLFTESQDAEPTGSRSGRVQEDAPAFATEFRGHYESEATHSLFEDVEAILKAKEENAGQ